MKYQIGDIVKFRRKISGVDLLCGVIVDLGEGYDEKNRSSPYYKIAWFVENAEYYSEYMYEYEIKKVS
jgi:hypothetical protein